MEDRRCISGWMVGSEREISEDEEWHYRKGHFSYFIHTKPQEMSVDL